MGWQTPVVSNGIDMQMWLLVTKWQLVINMTTHITLTTHWMTSAHVTDHALSDYQAGCGAMMLLVVGCAGTGPDNLGEDILHLCDCHADPSQAWWVWSCEGPCDPPTTDVMSQPHGHWEAWIWLESSTCDLSNDHHKLWQSSAQMVTKSLVTLLNLS